MYKQIQYILRNFHPAFPDWLYWAVLISIMVTVPLVPGVIYAGLRVPTIEFLNGMAWQPKPKTQGVSSLFENGIVFQQPVEGTVPRGYRSYPLNDPTLVAADIVDKALSNPLPATEENILRGKRVYETFCTACHGFKGYGNGGAVGIGRLDIPNSLHQDKVRDYNDGQIYHIIVMGQNKMPGYASQIPVLDRWAAVHYVRALQRSQAPTAEDIKEAGIKVIESTPSTEDTATTASVPVPAPAEPKVEEKQEVKEDPANH